MGLDSPRRSQLESGCLCMLGRLPVGLSTYLASSYIIRKQYQLASILRWVVKQRLTEPAIGPS